MSHSLKRGWLHLASGAAIGRFVGLLLNILLSRVLGPLNLGTLNLFTSTIQATDTLTRLGTDYAINYELGSPTNHTGPRSPHNLSVAFVQVCSITSALSSFLFALFLFHPPAQFPIIISTSTPTHSLLLILMILLEGLCGSAWELLLVQRRTSLLALKAGFFYPLRLLLAIPLSGTIGLNGALLGWTLAISIQSIWLKFLLKDRWRPFNLFPLYISSAYILLKRGLLFYLSNLSSSLLFLPLLYLVASNSGVADIGYLRVGQILQQVFAFLPSTLVPLLFLKMRSADTPYRQILLLQQPLISIWNLMLILILTYFIIDTWLINILFGPLFLPSCLATRLLLFTSLLEALLQLFIQPLLASGQTRLYAIWQNVSALVCALIGYFLLPSIALSFFLFLKVLYVLIPLTIFSSRILPYLKSSFTLTIAICVTVTLLVVLALQAFTSLSLSLPYLYLPLLILLTLLSRDHLRIITGYARGTHST